MKGRFTHNQSLISELIKKATFNPVAIAALPLSAIYFFLTLGYTADIEDLLFYRALGWAYLIVFVIMTILYFLNISDKNYIKATTTGSTMCGCGLGYTTLVLFNGDLRGDDFYSTSVVFFILFALILTGTMLYPKYYQKTKDALISNLEKCYLEFSDKTLSGIYYRDANIPGDGQFFELDYSEIRNVRNAQISVETKQYYNLFIDGKFGTLKLSLEESRAACDAVNKAITDINAGREVSIPTPSSTTYGLFGNNSSSTAKQIPLSQHTQGIGEWRCPECGKLNQNYVGTCGCGQVKPR